MRHAPFVLAFALAAAAGPAVAQKGGSLGNMPPPPPGQGPQGFGPRGNLGPQMALPRDKPPPLPGPGFGQAPPQGQGFGQGPGFGQAPPQGQGFGQPGPRPGGPAPGQMAALPRDKPPPLGAAAPGRPGGAPGGTGDGGPQRMVSSGTGFVVAPRQIMTNQHVVDGCTAMRARLASGQEIPATIIAADTQRDLALLRTESDPGPVLSFRRAAEVRRGENVVTYGFPLAGLLSSGPTLTTGDVSALAGLGDNPRQIQISAPVQQGNSGGPLLDLRGQVVGVIVSKLNAQRIAQATGDIPQNVNFAVKHTEAVDFMREHGVQPQLEDPVGQPRTAAEIGEVAHASTVFLRCLR
jgi:S1-C subfamily serine protease